MISVIIPTFNRGSLITETIESILNQTYEDFEIIVIDDQSTDNTFEIVSNYIKDCNKIRYYKRPKNLIKGGNSCRNFGLSIAMGEYVKWIDSDDLLHPSALFDQVESLQHSDFDLSICESVIFKDAANQEPIGKWGNIHSEENLSNFISSQFRWHTASGLWRRSYFKSTNVWKEGLTNSQEWLMHLTQLLNGINIVKVEKSLCLIRVHSGSMSDKSNKLGNYYFNECYARFLAIHSLTMKNFSISVEARRKLVKQFFVYQFFILYKGSIGNFLKSFKFYFRIIPFIFK